MKEKFSIMVYSLAGKLLVLSTGSTFIQWVDHHILVRPGTVESVLGN